MDPSMLGDDVSAIPESDSGAAGPFAGAPAPPPLQMMMTHGVATAGQPLNITVTAANPGDSVIFFWSERQGLSCPPQMNGQCIDLHRPQVLTQAVANANGRVGIQVQLPNLAAGTGIFVQAVVAGVSPYGSEVQHIVVDQLPTVCGSYETLNPTNVWNSSTHLVCTADGPNGCPTQLTQGQTNWMFEEASQISAGPFGNVVSQVCHEDTFSNQCCYVMDHYFIAVGRPLMVGDERRAATLRSGGAWVGELALGPAVLSDEARQAVTDRWLSQSRDEHASVAAFARFSLQLLALGAPPELVFQATQAQADEIRHARTCFAIARHVGGREVSAGTLNLSGAGDHLSDPASVLADTIREGCVHETIAAAQARFASEQCKDETLRMALAEIAEDEARHAALAWATVRWILSEHPTLRDVAQQAFVDAMVVPPAPREAHLEALRAWGATPHVDIEQLAKQTIETVIQPCADALFGVVAEA